MLESLELKNEVFTILETLVQGLDFLGCTATWDIKSIYTEIMIMKFYTDR